MFIVDPQDSQYTLAAIYFVVFILIGAFTLINLVVAVVVTNLVCSTIHTHTC